MRRVLTAFTALIVALGLCLVINNFAEAIPFVNGDFETGDLTGYFTEDDIGDPNSDITVDDDPGTGNHFASITPTGASWFNTLGQEFLVPSTPGTLSFDFAFSTQGSPDTVTGFPDSFAVSLLTFSDNDFLDILVVDTYGVLTDPSFGGWSIGYDSSVSIPGFVPFNQGTTFFGQLNLSLPGFVLGEDAAIYFDFFDELDGFDSIAAIDNLSFTEGAPIPEPGTIFLIGTGLFALARSRRTRKYC